MTCHSQPEPIQGFVIRQQMVPLIMGQSKSTAKQEHGLSNPSNNVDTLNGRYQTQTSPGAYIQTQRKSQRTTKSGKALSGILIGLGLLSILVQCGILFIIHE